MLGGVEAPARTELPSTKPLSRWRYLAIKVILLTLFSFGLGLGYAWASPGTYRAGCVAGFPRGMMHGALMPAALPSLLMGKDLPIYAASNIGRGYNIGFILGLNTCGTFFFGLAYWQPKRR